MKTSLAAITFALLFTVSASARVGDTIKQVEERYGKPQHVYNEPDRPGVRKFGYRFRALMVIVFFEDGISKWESFMGWPDEDRLPQLSRQTVNELLTLSAREGTSWHSIPRTKNGEYWASSDKKTLAFLKNTGKSLDVFDPNFIASD